MYVDLTLAVDSNDPVIGKASKDPNSYMSRGHIGTHLDVYPGQAVPPVEYVLRRGVLIPGDGTDAEITPDALNGIELRPGDFAIFHTGHLSRNTYGSREYFQTQPVFSWELVERMAAAGVSFVGLDFPGMRAGNEEHGQADDMVGKGGTYVIENLANVDQLAATAGARAFQVLTGWTGFTGDSGLSCRVVADVGQG